MRKRFNRNTLLRYKRIKELYLQHKTEDVPDTVVLRKYIYPIYPISRGTLMTVLSTPIEAKLQELIEAENKLSNHKGSANTAL